MKQLKLTQFGNPILRQRAKPLSKKQINSAVTQSLVRDMFYTMRKIGVGLAAPQVGKPLRLAVIEVKPLLHRSAVKPFPKTVIINPKISKYSKNTKLGWEGCLSCSDVKTGRALLWGQVPRANKITVEFLDERGKGQVKELAGFPARVFQHEIDHLNGIVFVDRMRDMKTLTTARELVKLTKRQKH